MLSFSFAFSVFFSLWLLIEDLEYWWPPGWVLFNYQVWLLCTLIISNFVEKTIIVTHLKFEQTVSWYIVLKKKKQTAKTFRYPPLFLGHAVMFSMSVKLLHIFCHLLLPWLSSNAYHWYPCFILCLSILGWRKSDHGNQFAPWAFLFLVFSNTP